MDPRPPENRLVPAGRRPGGRHRRLRQAGQEGGLCFRHQDRGPELFLSRGFARGGGATDRRARGAGDPVDARRAQDHLRVDLRTGAHPGGARPGHTGPRDPAAVGRTAAPDPQHRPAAARRGLRHPGGGRLRRRLRHLLRPHGRRRVLLGRTARLGAADQDPAGDGRRHPEGGALRRTDPGGERLCQPGSAGRLLDPAGDDHRHHRPAERRDRQRPQAGRGYGDRDTGERHLPLAGGFAESVTDGYGRQAVPAGRHRPHREGLCRAARVAHARERRAGHRYRHIDRSADRRGEGGPAANSRVERPEVRNARRAVAFGPLSGRPDRPRGHDRFSVESGRVGRDRDRHADARHGVAGRRLDRQLAALRHRRHAAHDAAARRGAQPHLARGVHHRHGHARRQRHRGRRQRPAGGAAGRERPRCARGRGRRAEMEPAGGHADRHLLLSAALPGPLVRRRDRQAALRGAGALAAAELAAGPHADAALRHLPAPSGPHGPRPLLHPLLPGFRPGAGRPAAPSPERDGRSRTALHRIAMGDGAPAAELLPGARQALFPGRRDSARGVCDPRHGAHARRDGALAGRPARGEAGVDHRRRHAAPLLPRQQQRLRTPQLRQPAHRTRRQPADRRRRGAVRPPRGGKLSRRLAAFVALQALARTGRHHRVRIHRPRRGYAAQARLAGRSAHAQPPGVRQCPHQLGQPHSDLAARLLADEGAADRHLAQPAG